MTRICLSFAFLSLFVGCRPEEKETNLRISERARSLTVLRSSLAKIDEPEHFWTALHAAEGLISAGYDREAVTCISRLLESETDAQKRCGLARELLRSGIGKGENVMREILRNDSKAFPVAAESLFQVGALVDEKTLRTSMNNSSESRNVLMAAAALARAKNDPDALQLIRNKLSDGNNEEVRLAAKILKRTGNQSDTKRLRTALQRTDLSPVTIATVHHSLATLGDNEFLENLTANLASQNKQIRTNAAISAGYAGAVHLIDDLAKQLNDPVLEARVRAAQSILVLTQN